MALPELPDIADSAFTNNHCFRYAGQTRFESDSVIKVEFEPAQFRRSGLQEYTVRARFSEIETGVPVLDQWELLNRFRSPKLNFVEIGQVFNIQWTDSTAVKPDTARRR